MKSWNLAAPKLELLEQLPYNICLAIYYAHSSRNVFVLFYLRTQKFTLLIWHHEETVRGKCILNVHSKVMLKVKNCYYCRCQASHNATGLDIFNLLGKSNESSRHGLVKIIAQSGVLDWLRIWSLKFSECSEFLMPKCLYACLVGHACHLWHGTSQGKLVYLLLPCEI